MLIASMRASFPWCSCVLFFLAAGVSAFRFPKHVQKMRVLHLSRDTLSTIKLQAQSEIQCDVAIVGGGPAGCSCALYTSRGGFKTVILDKNPDVGALAITNHIANYPGVDKSMSGAHLLNEMRQQAIDFGTDYRRAQVYMVDLTGSKKMVYTPDATFAARALVLATGAMGRAPSFEGEEQYLGRGVSYCATCDGAFYRGSEVAVVGTSSEAISEAEVLATFASTVHWITQGDPHLNDPNTQRLLTLPNVKQWKHSNVKAIEGDDSGVTGVYIKSKEMNSPRVLPVEGVFLYTAGSKPIIDFLDNKVALNENGGIAVDEEKATSVEGVYAIGDIRNTPFKQVVVAASDGCAAAMAIDRYLKGYKKVKVDWVHD